MKAADNPFNTSAIESLAYYDDMVDFSSILSRLEQLNYCGAIVGPHGNGKTVLFEQVYNHLFQSKLNIHKLFLNDRSTVSISGIGKLVSKISNVDIVMVDGAEQLNILYWQLLKIACKYKSTGLIITCHAENMLPTIHKCQTSLEVFCTLVYELVGKDIDKNTIESIYRQYSGNVREAFGGLYDIYAGR